MFNLKGYLLSFLINIDEHLRLRNEYMKIAILSNGESHTRTIVRALLDKGHEVFLITSNIEENYDGINVEMLPFKGKIGYLFNLLTLRKILKKTKPDILHAHYATGYGTLAHLAHYRPAVLSVWGSDVFDSYYSSIFIRAIVKWNLKYFDALCCTSKVLINRVKQIVPDISRVSITPFCVDCREFYPIEKRHYNKDRIVIGAVKSLEAVYGIDILIKAFASVLHLCNDKDIVLQIVGAGSQEDDLRKLIMELEIGDKVFFLGRILHEEVPEFMRSIDIFANLSRQESFGVSVIEASACGVPVIASDVGGLSEVVIHGKTGFLVPKENIEAAARAITKIILDPDLATMMGKLGRTFVLENYNIDSMARYFELAYSAVVSSNRNRQNKRGTCVKI